MRKQTALWQFVLNTLATDQPVMLLIVAESAGSSPGRRGFKMAVSTEGMAGSIGGGVMEIKLAEHARRRLQQNDHTPIVKQQVHRKDVSKDQSGMICSGEQTVIYFLLRREHEDIIALIMQSESSPSSRWIEFKVINNHLNIELINKNVEDLALFENYETSGFVYRETTGYKNMLYIIGGGHCSLALSEVMARLDLYIVVLDDREGLNTMEQNHFAHEKHVIQSYDTVGQYIVSGDHVFIVVMTLGYRSDLAVLKQLSALPYSYLGLLGSASKTQTLLDALKQTGFADSFLKSIHAPVGVRINSQTPEEIAISIAAQIIGHRNGAQA